MFWKAKPPMDEQLEAQILRPGERWEAMPPKPMPEIEPALLKIMDAQAALTRASKAWNRSQLEDAVRSARYFLDLADRAIDSQNTISTNTQK
jgi:hypothetical protein